MTISYQNVFGQVKYGRLLSLLFRWQGSIYKLVLLDLTVMLSVYYTLTFVYLYALDPDQQEKFRIVVEVCKWQNTIIPLSFVLGFYLKQIISRWWQQIMTLPWPDPVAIYVSSLIMGKGEGGRLVRRTIMRYVNLAIILTMRKISPSVKRRFHNLQTLVDIGVLTTTEMKMFFYLEETLPKLNTYWIPIIWSSNIIIRAKKEGLIRDDNSTQTILDAVNGTRGGCLRLLQIDFTSIPLVYTQAVTLAFYTYFLIAIMAHQCTEDLSASPQPIQRYIPFILILEFISYICALKIAEVLIAPFGDDDEDFEMNWMIDRNIMVSYAIVDEMHQNHPVLLKDAYWHVVFPDELPYREGVHREEAPLPSTNKISTVHRKSLLEFFRKKPSLDRKLSSISIEGSLSYDSLDSDGFEDLGEYDFDDSLSGGSSLLLFEKLREMRLKEKRKRRSVHFAPMSVPTQSFSSTSTSYVTLEDCGSFEDFADVNKLI